MGVFLHTAILPGCTMEAIPRRVKSESKNGHTFDLSGGQRFAGEKGVQILFEDDEADLEPLAGALSEAVNRSVLLAYIYDSDTWGYYLYDRGQEIDCFDAVPETCFLETPTEEQLTRLAGKPEVLARYFQVASEAIQNYLTFWTEELCEKESRAYPDDRYPYGDCWQLTDFLARLGWPWPVGTEQESAERSEQEPEQQSRQETEQDAIPTLADILEKNIPPVRPDPFACEGIYHLSGMPSALDGDYIRQLLDDNEDLRTLADQTPWDIVDFCRQEYMALAGKTMNWRLCALSAFCNVWLGLPRAAYWMLYETRMTAPNNIFLLRARGMAAAEGSKRHIAIMDLTALMELDPSNRDVYLLCRGFFHDIACQWIDDERNRGRRQADLDALRRIGVPAKEDTRVCWSGFSQEYLERVDGACTGNNQ